MKEQQKIFVKLLDEESIEVFRPVQAVVLEEGVYRLLGSEEHDPETETWEFMPGAIVKAKLLKNHNGEDFLAAVEEVFMK